MRGVRILHAVHAYAPSVGGSEAVVGRLTDGMVQRGHEVEIVTANHPGRGDAVDGVPVTSFPDGPQGWRAYRRWVHRGVADERWDVLMTYHSKVWTHLALWPFDRIAHRWVYCPTEFTDLGSGALRHRVYYRSVEPRSLNKAARSVVLTRSAAHQAIELAGGPIADRLRTIPNGVDLAWWADGGAGDVRAALDLPADAPLVLYVGGAWPHKRVVDLIDAVATTAEAHLVMAGDPYGERATLTSRARTAGIGERFHILGAIDRETLRSLYHAVDLHATASVNEGFGLTLLEALACSTPVVARPVGVAPELAADGLPVTLADGATSLAQAIENALSRTVQVDRDALARYDWEHIADQWLACYQEVAP